MRTFCDTTITRLKGAILGKIPAYIFNRIYEIADKDMVDAIARQRNRGKQTSTTHSMCLSMSGIMRDVLAAYQFNVELKFVAMFIANPKALEVLERHKIKTFDETSGMAFLKELRSTPGTWTLGTGWTKDENDYHALLEADGYFIDMTADQFNRPKKDIHMKKYIAPKDQLPDPIVFWQYVNRKEHYGLIGVHPRIKKIYDQVSRFVSESLGIPNIQAEHIVDFRIFEGMDKSNYCMKEKEHG